ncbi:hypothetical protein HPB51_022923 [Rhipicephalus microplus]|uniref:THAP-type domain-containing protein n=1 Tax=Rhipicephalus microplus TaxID=6941 RepID=A0A9J6DRE0_RHIMP|nr:hypothetical protein HPB51_022923 [Rhipicephalus microplus]
MRCVPQCTNRAVKDVISLHSFPLDVRLQKEWVVKLHIGKPVTLPMKVRSAHFVTEDFFRSSIGSASQGTCWEPAQPVRVSPCEENPDEALSRLFSVSRTNISRHFYSTLCNLSVVLKCAIPWPNKQEIASNLPKCFEEFKEQHCNLCLQRSEFPALQEQWPCKIVFETCRTCTVMPHLAGECERICLVRAEVMPF